MQGIPVGSAYAAFTDIGAVGAVTLGILASGDPARPARIATIGLVVAGVVDPPRRRRLKSVGDHQGAPAF